MFLTSEVGFNSFSIQYSCNIVVYISIYKVVIHFRLAKSQQEKAKKEAEKNVKNFQKIQKKADKVATKENDKFEKEKRKQSLTPASITLSSGD